MDSAKLNDDRYKVSNYRKDIWVHPRDWVLAWGENRPLTWKREDRTKKECVKEILFPHYNEHSGWEWIHERSHKRKIRLD